MFSASKLPGGWLRASVIAGVMFAAFACERRAGDLQDRPWGDLDTAARNILPWIENEGVFLVSPDARQLLIKNDVGHGDFELQLEDLESRKVIGRYRGNSPLLVTWRPDCRQIAFVADNKGDQNYRLHLWTPADGQLLVPDVPATRKADRLMRWSPDGGCLAFRLVMPDKSDQELLAIFEANSAKEMRIVFAAASILDFRWSPDGRRLAIVSGENDGRLVVVEPGTMRRQNMPVVSPAQIGRMAWISGRNAVLVTSREKGRTYDSLKEVDLESATTVDLAMPPAEIADVVSLEGGGFIASLADGQLMFGERGQAPRIVGFDEGGASLLAVDERHGDMLISYLGLAEPRSLYRFNLESNRGTLLFRRSWMSGAPVVTRRRVVVTGSDGASLSINVWRGGGQPSRGVVIRFPNAPGAPYENYAGADQYLTNAGYAVISFGLRPDASGEAGRNGAVTEQDILDALAVIDYAHAGLGIPRDKVVLTGGSNGATFVTETAARMRCKEGGIVLVGCTRQMRALGKISDHHFKVALLQGENDGFSPSMAKEAVEGVYGANALHSPDGLWRILAEEGHSPRQLLSRALLTAAICQVLSAPSSAPTLKVGDN